MTKLTNEQLDNYHSGRMSESEMADFNKLLESDPALKAESDLQSDIVNGLKEYRKLELKSRMDAINVGPTWIEFAQQSALMKSFGGVIIASLIGTGIYIYGERPVENGSDQLATVEAQKVESIDFVWSLGEEDESSTSVALDKPQKIVETLESDSREDFTQSKPSASDAIEQAVAKNNTESSQSEPEVKNEVYKPTFEAPAAESISDESEFTTTDLDEIPSNSESAVAENTIDVRSEITKSSIIKYKYYDGKLFLNGAFDKAPYEILEINSASGRRIYVYYLGSYYKVSNADKLTELPKVNNPEVISELKLLRENK